MGIIDRTRRALRTTPEEPLRSSQQADQFYDNLRRQGRLPPNPQPDHYSNQRQQHQRQKPVDMDHLPDVDQDTLDRASWGEFDEVASGMADLAEETRRIAAEREALKKPLPEVKPLEPTAPLEDAYEQFASDIERQLVYYRDRATQVIEDGLALAAEVRSKGTRLKDRMKAELDETQRMRQMIQQVSNGGYNDQTPTPNAAVPPPAGSGSDGSAPAHGPDRDLREAE
jgi:hypothetical protein